MMITNSRRFLGLVLLLHASVVISSTQIGGDVSSSNTETVPRRRKITYRRRWRRSAGADGDNHHYNQKDLGIASHTAAAFDAIQTMGDELNRIYLTERGGGGGGGGMPDGRNGEGKGKGKGGGGGGGTKSHKGSKAPTISKAPSISKTPKSSKAPSISKTPKSSKAPTASKAPSGCDGKGKGSSRSGTKVSKRRDYIDILLVYIFICLCYAVPI